MLAMLPAVLCYGRYDSWSNIFSLLLSSESSVWLSLPKSPFISSLSNVAILLVLMNDIPLSLFVEFGERSTSEVSFHCICDVIKQTVTSRLVSARTTAGLSLLPLKSVKWKSY